MSRISRIVCASVALGGGLVAQSPATQEPRPTEPSVESRLQALEAKLQEGEKERQSLREAAAKTAADNKAPKWYEKLSIRGYGQIRYASLFGKNNTPNINVPADRSVNEGETIYLRRGRVTISGDVTDRLYMYAQTEFAGTPATTNTAGTSTTDYTLQMRDFYGDYALNEDKSLRLRVGLSKVTFGWVNLQSSQNRMPLERPDAINSAAEGERDMGVYLLWAPKEIRTRMRDLVKSGLRGSGDYGVIAVGAYAGQGPNRPDLNGEAHTVVRAAYPFEMASKQVIEFGAQAYTGQYVVQTAAIGGTPPATNPNGVKDQRAAATFVLYPQPFGIEAEWNWGVGPQLGNSNTTITSEYLHGGYVLASYMIKAESGTWLPFLRWNYFDGARKFARNAPRDEVNEIDAGLKFAPVPEVEFTAQFTHTFWRTDTSAAGFPDATNVDRLGIQMQINF